jgi:hypothetical protein
MKGKSWFIKAFPDASYRRYVISVRTEDLNRFKKGRNVCAYRGERGEIAYYEGTMGDITT